MDVHSVLRSSAHRPWAVVALASGLVGLVWLAGTGAFLFNHEDTRFVATMSHDFGIRHNCLTSYVVAAHLAGENTENIYDPGHYRNAKIKTPIHEEVSGIVSVDTLYGPAPFRAFVAYEIRDSLAATHSCS